MEFVYDPTTYWTPHLFFGFASSGEFLASEFSVGVRGGVVRHYTGRFVIEGGDIP